MDQSLTVEASTAASPHLRDRKTILRIRGIAILPMIFTALIGAAVVLELRGMDIRRVVSLVPRSPSFWTVFAAFYLTGPSSEWVIYRSLWQIPAAGFMALLRKLVCNELLLGYLGEAYFYTWARRTRAITAAPFAAIKDVSILSAMAGNGMTLALLVIAWPMVRSTSLGLDSGPIVMSLAVVLATSIAAMAFRRRIFSLDRGELAFILSVHLARIAISTGLTAWLWHMVLPDISITWWLFLVCLRLLISRLPFLPNKDIVFAALAAFSLGHETDIAALMTMMASAILLAHVAVGAAVVAAGVVRPEN
ncbi:hypothetical protein [Novosphingobium album (ex Hu et al. 2023)]|uniref:Flippase-like domain-containing protein n=1 Tax=Novosphingobium album (ex Hu et al. 2023) TaxID=2930093 RepID=A0ABT0AXL1_9SPHN|nr:hypothetical protein [Novosphingobium album (ex Hu et al. 2023)]MCJ2177363.1 hypothetical protein [Novosphingobium album (ex Hu et al. 2023)]